MRTIFLGVLIWGCTGTIETAEAERQTTTVVARPSTSQLAETEPAPATVQETGNPPETAQPAEPESPEAELEPAPEPTPLPPAPESPAPPPASPVVSPAPPPAEDCSPPVPSAVDAAGELQAFTHDGRQLCGDNTPSGSVTKCGRTWVLDYPCPGADLCGGEETWDASGQLSEEQYICADCRPSTDLVVQTECAAAGLSVALVGCRSEAFPACRQHGTYGSDGFWRLYTCCPALPAGF